MVKISETDWHRFIVKTPFYDKAAIIDAINTVSLGTSTVPKKINKIDINLGGHISKYRILPFCFHKEGEVLSFLARNCFTVLVALCKADMMVKTKERVQIELEVRINARKDILSPFLEEFVLRRLDEERKFLDFSSLHNIPELVDMRPCPGSCPDLLLELLVEAISLAPNLVSICLADNRLESLKPLRMAYKKGLVAKLSSIQDDNLWSLLKLRVLDVSNNKLRPSELSAVKGIPITDLYFDCNVFSSNHTFQSYSRILKDMIPTLRKLDGVFLPNHPDLPLMKPNFFIPNIYGESYDLACQFVQHFFTLYDEGRQSDLLSGIYHKDAFYSQSVKQHQKMSKEEKQKNKKMCHGETKILKLLKELPAVQHDFYSFTIDVTHHSAASTFVTVTGLFRKLKLQDPKSSAIENFMRTFVLVKRKDCQYQITNDILTISKATPAQEEEAFRYPQQRNGIKERVQLERQMVQQQKLSLADSFSKVTGMITPYAYKCLEDAEWDYKEALTTFTEMFKNDKIPAAAFGKDKI